MTDAIEQLTVLVEGEYPDSVDDARAELVALRAKVEAQAEEIRDICAREGMAFERTVEASEVYNAAYGITDGRWPDLGMLIGWLLDERKGQANRTEMMRELLERAESVLMDEDDEMRVGIYSDVKNFLSSASSTGAAQAAQAKQIETTRAALDHSATLLGNVIQAFSDEEGDSAEMVLADCRDGIEEIRDALSSTSSTVLAWEPATGLTVVPLERLKAIEWVETEPGRYRCPYCDRLGENGHDPDCWIAAAIHGAERKE
jgi:hypothetical protein